MFRDARLKIDRANKHISDAHSLAIEIEKQHVSSIEDHPPLGYSIKYECPKLDDLLREMSLIAGDAIHDLRCALDYAWFATMQTSPGNGTSRDKFPFFETPQELYGQLRRREINVSNPALFKWITSDVKPYCGGNGLLYALHKADIADKHKLLIPVATYTGVSGIRIKNEHGEIIEGSSYPWSGPGPVHFDFLYKDEIEDAGNVSVSIVFNEGPIFAHIPIPEILRYLSCLTLNVTESLEQIVF